MRLTDSPRQEIQAPLPRLRHQLRRHLKTRTRRFPPKNRPRRSITLPRTVIRRKPPGKRPQATRKPPRKRPPPRREKRRPKRKQPGKRNELIYRSHTNRMIKNQCRDNSPASDSSGWLL